MKKFVVPLLALAAAFAMSPIAGVASANAAPVKHMTYHHVVHHPKQKTVCKVVHHKRVCRVVHYKPVHKVGHHTPAHSRTHHTAPKS
ncbi:MAG: hypothetical protein WBA36_18225 [Mesorhizobium sp.]